MSETDKKDTLPEHIAIIMDGNGRWAKKQNLPRLEGHRQGSRAVLKAMKAAQKAGIRYLTLYAFSVENWNRPKAEIDGLMQLLEHFLKEQINQLHKQKIRLRVIGRYEELPDSIEKQLREAEAATAGYQDYTLALALNYGSRTELIDAVRTLTKDLQTGDVDPGSLDYRLFSSYLYTKDLPDPDLIIRTSGEYRLSNFLLLQSAYSEIHITDVLWPDFDESDFQAALDDYATRERRYGKTGEQTKVTDQ